MQHLAIVGHNPGLSDLAKYLAPEGVTVMDLATGAACTLTFTARDWTHLAAPATRAVQYEPPIEALQPLHLLRNSEALNRRAAGSLKWAQHSGTFTASPPCEVSL